MICQNLKLKALLTKHAKEILHLLIEQNISFSILCDISKTTFDPPLPPDIAQNLDTLTLFVLAGYTFESIELGVHTISFEAGFGAQNFGSLVSIDYEGVVQILIQDSTLVQEISIFVNVSNPHLYKGLEVANEDMEGLEHSFFALSSNPKNAYLFNNQDEKH